MTINKKKMHLNIQFKIQITTYETSFYLLDIFLAFTVGNYLSVVLRFVYVFYPFN